MHTVVLENCISALPGDAEGHAAPDRQTSFRTAALDLTGTPLSRAQASIAAGDAGGPLTCGQTGQNRTFQSETVDHLER